MRKKLINGMVIETDYLTFVDTNLYQGSGMGRTLGYSIGLLSISEKVNVYVSFSYKERDEYDKCLEEARKEVNELAEIFYGVNPQDVIIEKPKKY